MCFLENSRRLQFSQTASAEVIEVINGDKLKVNIRDQQSI